WLLAFASLAAAQPGRDVLIHQSFDDGAHDWTSMGAIVQVTHDRAKVRNRSALAVTHEAGSRQIAAAILPAPPEFARMRRIRFWARTDYDTSLAVALNEKAGGRYMAWFWSPA